MTTKDPVANINIGDKVTGSFIVRKKLGEGSCGSVWLVETIQGNPSRYAMKVEPHQKSKDEEILRMEMYVLKKMQFSKHISKFIASGTQGNYSYMIMSLLGKDLVDNRRKCPGRKVSHGTTLRLSLQGVQALEDLHKTGFVHRDVKPCNFAIGIKNKKILVLFDFGLCRQIMLPDKVGRLRLREPRARVSFRGTVRYCSVNVHAGKEQGRHDDLYGLLYTMIETTTGTLPWKGLARVDSAKCKQRTSDAVLMKDCPSSFAEWISMLKKLNYTDTPPYEKIRTALAKNIKDLNVKMTDDYDWDKISKNEKKQSKDKLDLSIKDAAEKDRGGDNDTNRDVDESVFTETSVNNYEEGCAEEDTLDQAPDRMKTEEAADNMKSADR
ncbi:unnamed protein product, partial [Mesorhabditis belari]|uniref:Protein kinase domain-containing protein n=1 Tax=Mesorhabditis belari TaxID=2138241 RepID=A0AAF3FNA7_9BILA